MLTGFVLALLASAAWGVSDFLGGIKTRALPVAVVLAVSQTTGMSVLFLGLALNYQPMPHDGRLWASIAAGVASLGALGLLYLAMARGNIAVVAPIAASGAALPVVVGLIRHDPSTALTWVGIALALAGALGASWERGSTEQKGSLVAGGLLALGSAISVGTFFTLLDYASHTDPYWATLFTRTTACVVSIAFVAYWRGSGRMAGPLGLTPPTLLALAAIGVTDGLAEILFATSSTLGQLGPSAVLASMYPVITVTLAMLLLRERLRWHQAFAIVSALAGVVMLGYASGG
ncbi:DMT family transporter [Catellatospora sp. KI3]|uniref:EamA family transporter n=1 Tax=Catellatospora sp. KI3 TaxID=3041620 RepID=UPI0024831FBF|nr:DMT family transporter [Catellatospora sp. KI3]MDI1466075.1 DMT family transporter [Catellatospora sp. KI3]